MKNPVDEMMALDVLDNTCNIPENRNWLFSNRFYEIFALEGGDHATRVHSQGFERGFSINGETFTIRVEVQEDCCVAYIKEFFHLCELLKKKETKLYDEARWGNCFTAKTAEEAVKTAIVYGIELIKRVYDFVGFKGA